MTVILHLLDLQHNSAPVPVPNTHVIYFEEVGDISKLLDAQALAANPVLWNGNTPWPSWHHRPSAYYLWISATDRSVDWSVEPDYLFLCMNRQAKDHRRKMVRGLFKAGLHRMGAISYFGSLPMDIRPQVPLQFDFVPPKTCLPVTDLPMTWLNRSALSVITESTVRTYDISEKTFQCLAVGQPFISYGCVGLHHTLFSWGFKPLPGVDYAFDLEPDVDRRRKKIIQQLKIFSQHNPSKIKRHWRATCEYNRDHYIQQVRHMRLPFDVQSATMGHHAQQTIEELFKLQQLYQ